MEPFALRKVPLLVDSRNYPGEENIWDATSLRTQEKIWGVGGVEIYQQLDKKIKNRR